MASEIQFDAGPGLTGITAYAMLRNSSGQIWNTAGAAFEVFAAGSITDYDLALTEQGSSGFFVGDMPAVAAGLYTLTVKQQAGGSPAVSDTRIGGGEGDWNGTAFQSVANISSRVPAALVSGRIDASVGAMAANVITAAATAADYITEVQTAITGGAYDLDTDANGRIRIVDGTGAGEINTSGGVVEANVTQILGSGADAGYLQIMAQDYNSSSFTVDVIGIGAIHSASFFAGAIDAASLAADAGTEIGTAVWAAAARTLTALDEDSTTLDIDAAVSAAVTAALTTALTEGYRGTGATGSVRDLLYELIAHLGESAISGTTKTLKKLDAATTAKTYTLDDATTPTAITETT